MKDEKVLTVVKDGKLIHAGDPLKFDTELLASYCRTGFVIATFTIDEFRLTGWKMYEQIPQSYTHEQMQHARAEAWDMACKQILKDIADGFIANEHKAETYGDKAVFRAVGETMQNFPHPDKETYLAQFTKK